MRIEPRVDLCGPSAILRVVKCRGGEKLGAIGPVCIGGGFAYSGRATNDTFGRNAVAAKDVLHIRLERSPECGEHNCCVRLGNQVAETRDEVVI